MERLLTPAEVGNIINGLDDKQVKYLCRSGKIGYIKLGREYRIRPAQLAHYLEKNEVPPCEDNPRSTNIQTGAAPTGKSNSMTESERDASRRAASLVRKIRQQTPTSQRSH